VLVHGLWLNGLEFFVLRDRLQRAGFAPSNFHYSSMHATLAGAADALGALLRRTGEAVHIVAHSLGAIVTLETLSTARDLPPGRAVFLGPPVQGSRAAKAIASWSHGPQILGGLALAELAAMRERRWDGSREIGVIAGSRSAGLGRLCADLPRPNDGSVCVSETRLPGASAEVILDVSHTGMLFSTDVAVATATFLASGRFAAETR
jgi:pimeloyl-ACP methyl ester carboxylesterase